MHQITGARVRSAVHVVSLCDPMITALAHPGVSTFIDKVRPYAKLYECMYEATTATLKCACIRNGIRCPTHFLLKNICLCNTNKKHFNLQISAH